MKKITDAEAQAMVQTANGADQNAAASARQQLVQWVEKEVEFECEATRRWVAHTVMIHGFG
ncbi:MAG TPA: hypothetical protein VK196_06205 [Magnetospirillum sp.]|nr:hypothetical protein [Magnetospirillum sp.]